MTNAFLDKKGMSLIELLIAIALLSLVSVAILKTNMVAFQTTTVNVLREEALRLAEEDINKVHSLGFTKEFTDAQLIVPPQPAAQTVLRNLRGTHVSYTVQRTIADMTDMKQVTVEVRWQYRDRPYNIRLTTILGRAS